MSSMAMAHAPTDVTDESLAQAARSGDRRAFETLVERYREPACAYAYARLGSRDEAEDISQDAFVRALIALNRFRVTGTWAPWMMRIVRNLCHDALRKRLVRKNQPIDAEIADTAPMPESQAIEQERQARLNAAVAGLHEKYRIPLLMHYSGRRTYKEIALALGVPQSTIVGRLAGALRILRREMAEDPL